MSNRLIGIRQWFFAQGFTIGAIIGVLVVAACLAAWLTPYRATPETPFAVEDQTYGLFVRAEVTSLSGDSGQARILDGDQSNQRVEVRFYNDQPRVGSIVLIPEQTQLDEASTVTDVWRMPALIALVAVMIVLVVVIGGRQGALSIVGLGISIAVIAGYLIPQVLAGHSALIVSCIAAFAIATISILVAHALRWRTVISLLSIYAVLGCVVLFAAFAGWYTSLTGIYDETSSLLGVGAAQSIDMYGILIGGIVIATLGVLDDVVTTQVAAVDELHKLKPRASWRELFIRGMSVGREHLSALVNTLALAYVGVALPTILILSQSVSTTQQGLLNLNYEYIAIEIVRTVVSSIGLIMAIPLSTALAAALVGKKRQVIGILRRVKSNPRR